MQIRTIDDAVACLDKEINKSIRLVVLTKEEATKIRNIVAEFRKNGVVQNGKNNMNVVNNGSVTMHIGGKA